MATRADQAPVRPFWHPDLDGSDWTPWTFELMERVFEEQQPPFLQGWYGNRYREFALDPDWLAGSFVANAEKEAQGSRKLAAIASEARGFAFAPAIVSHAEDEARHARMYVAMLKLVFPDALDEKTRRELLATFPAPGEATIDDLPPRTLSSILDDIVQMNIGEVRTRLHQMLLRPVAMIVCPPANRSALGSLLDRILADEGRHILYTCRILEDAAGQGFSGHIAALYERRCSDFSEITLREVGVGQFD